MATSAAEFFESLGRRGHEPLLGRVSATVRVDLTDGAAGEHRLIRMHQGDIRVSADNEPADCVLRADLAVFDSIVRGEMTMMVALLRGLLDVEGDPELLVLTQRLFPGPPPSSSRPDALSAGERTS